MSNPHADLVIQISTSAPVSAKPPAGGADSQLIEELGRWLQPGVEIGLIFEGYTAITAILWLSGLQPDRTLRAGIRLLGVSALPIEHPELVASIKAPGAPFRGAQAQQLSANSLRSIRASVGEDR
jgi:hypothetical protein